MRENRQLTKAKSAKNAATNTFTHNVLNQMVGRGVPTAPQAFAISHDLDGNMTSDGIFTYSYDAANRLSTVTSNNIVLVANQYDYKGRRIRKTTPTTETTFIYDGWNLIHETVATITGATTNTTEIQYFWGTDLSESLQGAGGVGGLLATSVDGFFYFPAYDNNGNVTKYIDESGNVVAAYEYDDFGRIISQTGSMADIFHHRFSTKYYDPEIDLYYYGYRFYAPALMRWLNRDPLEESGGLNLYVFCGNIPVSRIDVLGLLTFKETVVTLYDLVAGVKPNSILAYTDASAVVRVMCECKSRRWGLKNVEIDFMTTIHHPRGGYGDKVGASLFAHKSEAEHVSDIKAGVRYRIVPEVTVQETILKIALYDSEPSCVSANKKTISDKVLKMLTKISQESVEKHDKSGKHVWRGL